jgi:curved DNA-binding protein CbpA
MIRPAMKPPVDRDLYAQYNLDPDADQKTIRKRRRLRLAPLHTDKHPDASEERKAALRAEFDRIDADLDWLVDADKRRQYDSGRRRLLEKEAAMDRNRAQARANADQLREFERKFGTARRSPRPDTAAPKSTSSTASARRGTAQPGQPRRTTHRARMGSTATIHSSLRWLLRAAPPGVALPASAALTVAVVWLVLVAVVPAIQWTTGVVGDVLAAPDNFVDNLAEQSQLGRKNPPRPLRGNHNSALVMKLQSSFDHYLFKRTNQHSGPGGIEVAVVNLGEVRRRKANRATYVTDVVGSFIAKGANALSAEAQFRPTVRFARSGTSWSVQGLNPSLRKIAEKLHDCDVQGDTDSCDFR